MEFFQFCKNFICRGKSLERILCDNLYVTKMLYTDFFASQNKEAKSSAHQRVRIFASQKQGGFMDILKACGLRKIYGSGETAVHALDGVDLTVEKGEFVAIVGTSGSGKSTLLHMLGGLDRPTEGKVFVDGKDIFALKDEELTIFRRRKIGFVFQAYNLVPVLNVYENIVLPIELDGGKIDRKFIDSTWIAAETGCTSGTALRWSAAEGGDRKGISGSTGDHIGG